MAVCEIKYFSKALQKATAATVILPEAEFKPPFCTFYLLHGLSDDHTIWQRRTSIERYVNGLPLIVVMPDSGRGFYTDAQTGMAWESAIAGDLVSYIDNLFQTKATREGRCIGGLSMGGYGAVKLALKYPHLFCSAVSHSGAVAFGHHPLQGEDAWQKEFRLIVGENPQGGENDPFALAERLKPEERPLLRIDCGVDDFLLDSNREFHAYLNTIGYTHEYEEFPGAHTWDYWDVHVQEAVAFHKRNLGL